ncbi:hypothetical protein P43SY_001061 [Pythium insidiosum]|uniref:Exopolysaccharide phosphotransferase n=1 Tax=Pythium insidiosum TaxID=114742 RepID=A0AAD5M5L0_PYTIN|nr:hypothetical protein P43SY_001061 [Pythium insidiosum]
MQGFFALIGASLLLALVLFVAQPDPPEAILELSSGGLGDWSHGVECEIKNFAQLRKSAIVYTWVNGTERCYNERRRRAGLPPGGSSRDKEMGELKYSLRSLLKFAPWLEGPIYIVTPGQIPDWLDTSNPRITVIDQDDLLPREKTAMPNFDTNVIEQYLHKIPGLTDIFIHMNDDYLFVKPITPHRFFTCDGGIRFLTEVNHIRHVKGTQDNAWLASVRNTVELTDKLYGGTHVYNFLKHAPFVYSRHAFEKIHERFSVELDATLVHQIRHYQDLNIPLLHHIYMNEEGSKLLNIPVQFNPIVECDDWLLVRIADDNHDALKDQFKKALAGAGSEVLLALNDEYDKADTAEIVREFYEALLPTPEFYELPTGQRRTIDLAEANDRHPDA